MTLAPLLVTLLAGSLAAAPPSQPPQPAPSPATPASALASIQDGPVQLGDRGAELRTLIQKTEQFGFTGSLLISIGGKVILATSVGHADLDGKIPATPATLYEIASCTKQFTAAAVLILAQRGKLKLDDPIDKYLPDVPDNCKDITIRHLLGHTSGIPGTNSKGGGDDITKVLPTFLAGGPKTKPGKRFEYWNQGYALLSEIIAKASGQSYTDFCREALFRPAGLKVTCFTGDLPPAVPGAPGIVVSTGLSGFQPSRSALDHPYGSYGLQYRGMGGIVSSVWDMYRWDRALAATKSAAEPGALLTAASKKELFTPGPGNYALGWNIKKDQAGREIQFHGGAVRGFTCQFERYPDINGCLIVLANSDVAPTAHVANLLQAAILQPDQSPSLPDAIDDAGASKLTGIYTDDKGNKLTITIARPTVPANIAWAARRGLTTQAFIAKGPDGEPVLFEWPSVTTKLLIDKSPTGSITGITLGAGSKFVPSP